MRNSLDSGSSQRVSASIAADLEVSDQTVYTWRKQEPVDAGVEPGVTSFEAGELRVAKRRISVLETETELAVTGRANEPLKEQMVSPKGGSKRSR